MASRRQIQKIYQPGTLFIMNSNYYPGQSGLCMIIGWSNSYDRNMWSRDPKTKNWQVTYVYPVLGGNAGTHTINWEILEDHTTTIEAYA